MRDVRCAIYTRKSTEEGLDQEFNSLDVKSLAVALKMDRSNVARIMRLATLSPKILRAVLRHELPAGFSVEKLYNIKSDIWSDQEAEIGLTPLS